jgi:exosortase A-associated hydrolase 1
MSQVMSQVISHGEVPFVFTLGGDQLIGILHEAAPDARRGLLMVVGGPQYRVGGHRHYVKVARRLAATGVPVLRYDYRGIGDSTGQFHGFENLDDDIRAGIDALVARVPTVQQVVLWGLCESASAIALYAHSDPRVAGAILVNPYASTVSGKARTILRHYYLMRLVERDFWKQLFLGRIILGRSLRSLARAMTHAALGGNRPAEVALDQDAMASERMLQIRPPDRIDPVPLPERMARGLEKFAGQVLLVISGDDLTAAEFLAACDTRRWADILDRDMTARVDIAGADHTFSRKAWLDELVDEAHRWLASW